MFYKKQVKETIVFLILVSYITYYVYAERILNKIAYAINETFAKLELAKKDTTAYSYAG